MGDFNFRMWEVTKQHLGENGETVAVELQDPDGWFDANVRWDGLLELHLYHNAPKGENGGDEQNGVPSASHGSEPPSEDAPYFDTLHLADLDGFIRRLQELKATCQELFDFQDVWKQEDEGGRYEV